MAITIDLDELAARESEQIEWKENVADIDDVVAVLSAFANDLANLGGGYVVCGAREEKDAHGFDRLVRTGLTSARLREVEGKVLALCRDRVNPALAPLTAALPAATDDRRILVFVQPATRAVHSFRRKEDGSHHYVRVGRSTIEARNGLLRDLLVHKSALDPWDRRPCPTATVDDLDLLALRDTLQRMKVFSAETGVEHYLSATTQLSSFVPPLCAREPLTDVLRPRNFAMLLFGRETQRHVPGAFSVFSLYPGTDRSDLHAERQELDGTVIEQARRLRELLDIQSFTAFDKSDLRTPNAIKYPKRALYEAMGNALAHRDYEVADPARITVFADRIEVISPGSLPLGVSADDFRAGRAGPRWRNQTLAWFFNRLQLAQAEGQGIPTIIRSMREEGCPPPILDPGEVRVACILPAHPRHALLRELREAETAITLGELHRAQALVADILRRDPFNMRALQVFAEVQHNLRDARPLLEFVERQPEEVERLPAALLLQFAETLVAGDGASEAAREASRRLLMLASRGRLEERELRRIGVAMLRAHAEQAALSLVERQLIEHPEWQSNASVLQLRGDAMLGLAKKCRFTARNRDAARATRQRAWRQFDEYLEKAERDLRDALAASIDSGLTQVIRRNLDFLDRLRRDNPLQRRA